MGQMRFLGCWRFCEGSPQAGLWRGRCPGASAGPGLRAAAAQRGAAEGALPVAY